MENQGLSMLERIMAARESGRTAKIVLTAGAPLVGLFTLFGRGVALDVAAGCSVRELVSGELGISEDYLAGGIQTIFLDGWAVDDIETATVAAGSVLALSAAMPGLVGATMRRGGHYAVLRGNITLVGRDGACSLQARGTIGLKLFNQVARDLAPQFLQRGVWVEGDRFVDFLRIQPRNERFGLSANGDPIPVDVFLSTPQQDRSVFLSVMFEGA